VTKFTPFTDSLWHATAVPAPQTPPLAGKIQADVCIVGAGFTGLATALRLAQAGIRAVVVEAQEVGFGGSGRNAGQCTPAFSKCSLPELRRMLGEPWADRLITRQTRANDFVADVIQKYKMDCEWIQTGYILAAPRPDSIAAMERKVEEYNHVGAKTRVLSPSEVEDMTGSARFFGGWFHEEAGHLNPLGHARSLANAILSERGEIYTSAQVKRVDPNPTGGWAVKTTNGSVIADKVIFSTGAYTVEGWPKLDQTYKVQKGFVAATQVLPADIRSAVLPHNITVTDGRGDLFGYKYNGQGRIVVSMIPMGGRGRDLAYTKQMLTERLKWLHPQIKVDLNWEFFWTGDIDLQVRTIPRFYSLAPGVVGLTGLSGRGIPTGSMLGGILSEWAQGVRAEDLSLKLEPLSAAPFYMGFAPRVMLRYYRGRDWARSKLGGIPIPQHP
jgi:glycine/D-amino acid oxidase-like deaminating enzyme